MLRETLGRRLEKGPARNSQAADDGRAVIFREARRRATGGVIAELRFALEHRHGGELRKLIRGARPGDASADHDDVRLGAHGFAWAESAVTTPARPRLPVSVARRMR